MTKVQFFIRVAKTKTGRVARILIADVGYRHIFLSFNDQDVAELLHLAVCDYVLAFTVREGEVISLYPVEF